MKIALDYDNTYTLDKSFWDGVVALADDCGHEVRIVTARSPNFDAIPPERLPFGEEFPVEYCDGVAKKFHCTWFADNFNGWVPDVWIDDKPEGVNQNSTASREFLVEWRASWDYNK